MLLPFISISPSNCTNKPMTKLQTSQENAAEFAESMAATLVKTSVEGNKLIEKLIPRKVSDYLLYILKRPKNAHQESFQSVLPTFVSRLLALIALPMIHPVPFSINTQRRKVGIFKTVAAV